MANAEQTVADPSRRALEPAPSARSTLPATATCG